MSKLLEALPTQLEMRRTYSVFSDFTGTPPRQQTFYRLADLSAGSDLAATIIMATTRRIVIHDVSIMPDGSNTGIDNSNTSVWLVTDGSNTIVTKTYNASTTFPADSTIESLGTPAYSVIEAGGRVELTVTNGTTADTPAVQVVVTYSDLEAYPDNNWKIAATDDGTATISDGVDGVMAMTPSDATAGDNDEIYLFSSRELFKHADGKAFCLEARVQFTEANTDDANVAFGLADAVGANTLLDDGGGLKASFEGAAIYKVDGGTVWKCVTSKSTTQTISTSTTTAGGSAYQKLRIEVMCNQSIAEYAFFVDEIQLADSNGRPIKHRIDYSTSPTEMAAFLGLKNGGTNAETLNVAMGGAWQAR